MARLSRHSSRTVVPSRSDSIELVPPTAATRAKIDARMPSRSCGTRSRSKPAPVSRTVIRTRAGSALPSTVTASPEPPACCAAFAIACVAASTSARAIRPGHRRRAPARSSARRATRTPSSSAARSMSSATARGIPRLVAALLRVLLGVGQASERLARHRDGERALARRVRALRGDQRRQDAVVHESGDGDALLLGGIRRRRLPRTTRPRGRASRRRSPRPSGRPSRA